MKNINITAFGDSIAEGDYTIHSVFKKVVNYQSNNNLLVLSNDINYLSPSSVIIPDIKLDEIKQIIKLKSEAIIFNRQEIPLSKNEKYSSAFNFKLISYESTNKIILSISKKYLSLFPLKSIAFLLEPGREKHFTSAFEKQFYKIISGGVSQFKNKQIINAIQIIKGTGTGLTPSGDDFVAGVLFGLHFNEYLYKKDLSSLKKQIFKVSQTANLFSSNFIKSAYNGLFFYRLKQYLEQAYISPFETEKQLKNLFSIGNNSGADLLTGLILTLKYKIGI